MDEHYSTRDFLGAYADTIYKEKRKPGRKANPASPALRKAQNRAAQRAFRERKERHITELEVTKRQLTAQRDQLLEENERLKKRTHVLVHESWYLKKALLTLHLVCYVNQVNIPIHNATMRQETMEDLAQVYPSAVATYTDLMDKLGSSPTTLSNISTRSNLQQPSDHKVSEEMIMVSKGGIFVLPSVSDNQHNTSQCGTLPTASEKSVATIPLSSESVQSDPLLLKPTEFVETEKIYLKKELAPRQKDRDDKPDASEAQTLSSFCPQPVMLTKDPLPPCDIQAIQTACLRSHMQTCIDKGSNAFVIEPTNLQRAIPHDPRIDLIPFQTMRDRMVLFRGLFDLEDCVKLLLEGSTYKCGDPSQLENWFISDEFYKRFWFLCLNYKQRETWQQQATHKQHAFLSSHPPALAPFDVESSKHPFSLPSLADLFTHNDQVMQQLGNDSFFLDFDTSTFSGGLPENRALPSDSVPSTDSQVPSVGSPSDMEEVGSIEFSTEPRTTSRDKKLGSSNPYDFLMNDFFGKQI